VVCVDVSSLAGDGASRLKRKVVIALNTAWNLVNFRAGLIKALVKAGFEVVAVAPVDEYAVRLNSLGCRFIALPMDNQGTHPGRDLLLLWRFFWLLRREQPGVFLGYTIKPNVYGSLAAHFSGIPVVNNIAGLGAVFIKGGLLARFVRGLYRLALSRSAKVFFQNNDDLNLFVDSGLVRMGQTDRVPGSGVDLSRFSPQMMPANGRIRFLLIARLLWDKGVGEYLEAARILKRHGTNAEFCILGFLDVKNPTAVSRSQMDGWVTEGLVSYLGETDDVRSFIAESDCVVLPSYREGVPRSLLEAAAMGKAIIATDVVGCREVVEDGVNGYLCKPMDSGDLASKMEQLVKLTPEARHEMGRKGREKIEREFDEKIVIGKYLEAIAAISR
jgi:glycosyltransferase involved in cell wall biosynthesis